MSHHRCRTRWEHNHFSVLKKAKLAEREDPFFIRVPARSNGDTKDPWNLWKNKLNDEKLDREWWKATLDWQNLVELSARPWTSKEDEILKAAVTIHGTKNWKKISMLSGLNRCDESCRERWITHFNPDQNKEGEKFSEKEEELLVQLLKKHRASWTNIAGYFPGRSALDIKNHWYNRLRKKFPQLDHDLRMDLITGLHGFDAQIHTYPAADDHDYHPGILNWQCTPFDIACGLGKRAAIELGNNWNKKQPKKFPQLYYDLRMDQASPTRPTFEGSMAEGNHIVEEKLMSQLHQITVLLAQQVTSDILNHIVSSTMIGRSGGGDVEYRAYADMNTKNNAGRTRLNTSSGVDESASSAPNFHRNCKMRATKSSIWESGTNPLLLQNLGVGLCAQNHGNIGCRDQYGPQDIHNKYLAYAGINTNINVGMTGINTSFGDAETKTTSLSTSVCSTCDAESQGSTTNSPEVLQNLVCINGHESNNCGIVLPSSVGVPGGSVAENEILNIHDFDHRKPPHCSFSDGIATIVGEVHSLGNIIAPESNNCGVVLPSSNGINCGSVAENEIPGIHDFDHQNPHWGLFDGEAEHQYDWDYFP